MQNSGKQHSRYVLIALLLTLIISNLAGCATPETQSKPPLPARNSTRFDFFSAQTLVMLFSSSTGEWILTTFEQAKPGDEFTFNNQLYRVFDSAKALVVPKIDTSELIEADLPYDNTSRRPKPGDVVQILDKGMQFMEHAVLSTVPPGATIRFQGKVYSVTKDRSLADTKTIFPATTSKLRRIEITKSAMQHITDRHTVGGTKNAGASIFNAGENIQTLIKNAQLTAPVIEANGYFKRVFDAGRNIGVDGRTGKRTSTYRVITTQSGKLVTVYPVVL